jgi:hypothetical protein
MLTMGPAAAGAILKMNSIRYLQQAHSVESAARQIYKPLSVRFVGSAMDAMCSAAVLQP